MSKIQAKQIDPQFPDDEFRLQDNSDNTKEVAFQLSGLTTSTTRTITVQDSDGTMAYLSDISGGSQKVVEYDAIVAPSGGDFTTVKAALDNGDQKILVTGNITETASLTVSGWDAQPIVHLMPGVTWDFSTFTYNTSGSNVDMTIAGVLNGVPTDVSGQERPKLTYSNAAGSDWFSIGSNQITFKDVTLDNNATTNGSATTLGGTLRMYRCRVDIPNITDAGIITPLSSSGTYCIFEDVHFVGGGTNSTAIESGSAHFLAQNLQFSGTWSTSDMATFAGSDNNVEGIYFESSGSSVLNFARGNLANVVQEEAAAGNLDLTLSSDANVSNIRIQGTITASTDSIISNFNCESIVAANRAKFSNGEITGSLANSTFNNPTSFSNIVFISGGTMSLGSSSDESFFLGCRFQTTPTIDFNSTANEIRFIACNFGANEPTLSGTIPTGANRPMFIGCAPTDSNTEGAYNGEYDAVVGTGSLAPYSTIKDAIDDGHRNILLLSNVSESSVITIGSTACKITGVPSEGTNLPNITLGSNIDIDITGSNARLELRNLEITASLTSSGEILDFSGAGAQRLVLDRVTIDNNSSAASAQITGLFVNIEAKQSRFELPNFNNCGVTINSGRDYFFDNCEFVGGGTGCGQVVNIVQADNQVSFKNVYFSGTFSNTTNVVNYTAGNSYAFDWNGLLINGGTNRVFELPGNVRGLRCTGANTEIHIPVVEGICSSWDLNGGILRPAVNGGHFSNIKGISDLDLGAGLIQNLHFSNCEFTGAITLSDNNHSFSDCRFGSTLTLSGDLNRFSSCVFVGTLTINSGSTENIFAACDFQGTFTDNSSTADILAVVGSTPFSFEEKVIKSIASVDLTSTGSTNLFTVPTGRSFFVTKVLVELTSATAAGGDAQAQVEITASAADIIASQTLTGLDATTEFYNMTTSDGLARRGAASNVIKFNVTSADTGTTATATVHLMGVLL